MAYLSIHQISEKWGISTRRIQTLCGEGRIPGATKIGSYWAIPDDAEKPIDARIKSGRYIKKPDGNDLSVRPGDLNRGENKNSPLVETRLKVN